MKRVVVIGTSGSGKSTLAEQLAQRFGCAFVELDALFWEAGWTQVSTEVFRQRVADAIAGECWVIGGNYSRARDLIWARADTLVWLDYAFPLVISRLFRRTVRRIRTQEDLWGTGNRETWRKQFLSIDSLFVWALKSHWRYRRQISGLLEQPEYAHLRLLRFTSPAETERWRQSLKTQA